MIRRREFMTLLGRFGRWRRGRSRQNRLFAGSAKSRLCHNANCQGVRFN